MRILIVEDEPRIADFLERGLRAEGHFCVVTDNGKDALSLATDGDFGLLLLDLILPGMHGLDVCQKLRMNRVNTPIIILTGMDSPTDVVAGLRMGADDYITKPFSFEELLARIETQIRRGKSVGGGEQVLRAGPLVFDCHSMRFSVDGKVLKMTAKELAIIELLMSNPGTLFSRERILSNVWGLNIDPLTNIVDVYVGKLRKKIDSDPADSLIETVRGLGYRLKIDPSMPSPGTHQD